MSEILLIKILFWLTLFFFLFYLMKPRLSHKDAMQEFYAWRYAHRGYHDIKKGIPENSLQAFQRACEHGYGMELDVQLTRDKQLIVLHDFNLLRACGIEKEVADLTLEEIKQLRLFGTECAIPTFEEVLQLVNGQTPLIVEIKQKTADCETCVHAARLLDQYKGKYCVESFHPMAVRWFKKHRPHYLRGQLSGELHMKQPAKFILENLLTNFLARPDFIAYDVEHRNRIALRICIALYGSPLVYWTVKDKVLYEEVKDAVVIFEGFEA